MELDGLILPLLSWYQENRRSLPWREDPTPYHIWVSEIMLQQTRIEAVKGYYVRFLAALPNIEALSEADEETLLKLWQGLGYYNRVRNLHKAAVQIVAQYDGEMPGRYDELLTLPGIGAYTAGAIASIGFGECVPCVYGNVLRVVKRYEGGFEDIANESVKRDVWQRLKSSMEQTLPEGSAGAFNEALMELGEVICIPNGTPLCEKCPLANQCVAHKKNLWQHLPVKSPKKARRIEERTVFVLRCEESVALRKRNEKGLLAGLWELPQVEGHLSEEEAMIWLRERGLEPVTFAKTDPAKHIFTHVEWHMSGYVVDVEAMAGEGLVWTKKADREAGYALPSALDGFLSYLS